jgi:beta-phosphoglucomutase-like phosphatase (HAD superfamily)
VAFEDADKGIESALAAGMRVVDVRPAYHAWRARGADVVAGDESLRLAHGGAPQ